MAIQFHCDGCNAAIETPVRVGNVIEREYCETCAGIGNKFLDDEEALRKKTQEDFIDGRASLIANAPQGFKLPDVPRD